ncbi:MAG: hypothetical protein HY862_05240 [Chloroflexi bacterium]|nr:hypothetical protein [Chloroflexota bacterium]
MFQLKKRTSIYWIGTAALGLILLSACAPSDKDFTPTAPPPTLTPTPTPAPTGNTDGGGETQAVDPRQEQLDAIVASIPVNMPAGAEQWQIDTSRGDKGFETPPNVQNGIGRRVFYRTQAASAMQITYAVFDTAELAHAHFERLQEVRSTVLKAGTQRDDFPAPNIFGLGTTTGSVALIQDENYFVEVFIEVYSSVGQNPLVASARQAINVLNAGVARYSTPNLKPARMEAVDVVLPDQFTLGEAVWERDASQNYPEPLEVGNNGLSIRAIYKGDAGSEVTFNYTVFDTADDAAAYYADSSRQNLSTSLRLNPAGQGQTRDDFPQPNVFASGVAYIAGGAFQSNDVFVVIVSLETTSIPEGDPLGELAQQALSFLQQSLVPTGDQPTIETTPAPTEAATETSTDITPEATQQIVG